MMASRKCIHKGCGKTFTDASEECIYHPGPPIFHEGQKGWKCCKPRVLTFDEFLAIPPCTTGTHSDVEEKPAEQAKAAPGDTTSVPAASYPAQQQQRQQQQQQQGLQNAAPDSNPPRGPVPQRSSSPPPPPPESDSDDPSLPLDASMTCRRRGCTAKFSGNASSRDNESCVFHPGWPTFHDGGKGYTCCRRRVLEFDEFMKIEGCKTKPRHMFVGSGKKVRQREDGEEIVETVKNDFYQTGSSVIASFYLKKIDAARAKVEFSSAHTLILDLPTADKKRYRSEIPLYASIDPEKSTFKIMGTKLELTLVKTDGAGWPALRSDHKTNEIIQVGQAGKV